MYQKILQKVNRVISLNGTAPDFPVDHSSIKKEEILNIHQNSMIKISTK